MFLVYHGLDLNLMYPADLLVYFGLIQILLQPLYIAETLIHILAIYLKLVSIHHLLFVILSHDSYRIS